MARPDRDPPEHSPYANTGSVPPEDRDLLSSPTGRVPPTDEGPSTAEQDEIREKSGGGRPASDKTNFHLSGTGGAETPDGLDETAEALRHAAEDVPDEPNPYVAAEDDPPELDDDGEPIEQDPSDPRDEPVFDRAQTIRH